MNPGNLKYSSTHEWVKPEDGIATLGITDYAQSELGEVVLVELSKVGAKCDKGDVIGTIESYKTVSELMCPVFGAGRRGQLHSHQFSAVCQRQPLRTRLDR